MSSSTPSHQHQRSSFASQPTTTTTSASSRHSSSTSSLPHPITPNLANRRRQRSEKKNRTPTTTPTQRSSLSTTSRRKHDDDATSITTPVCTVYLIRHGESEGQRASREARKTDPSLVDCRLTETGRSQALAIRNLLGSRAYETIGTVVSSPLTRAVETTLLAFPDKPVVIIHYDLREVGGRRAIPENTPRGSIHKVVQQARMLQQRLVAGRPTPPTPQAVEGPFPQQQQQQPVIDTETFRPAHWPRFHDTPPKVVRRDQIRQVFQMLASLRSTTPEPQADHKNNAVAVVCHFHVIRAALSDPYHCQGSIDLSPQNAQPIQCDLYADGRLRVVQVLSNDDNGGLAPMNVD